MIRPEVVVKVSFFSRRPDDHRAWESDVVWPNYLATPQEERELTDALADLVALRRSGEK